MKKTVKKKTGKRKPCPYAGRWNIVFSARRIATGHGNDTDRAHWIVSETGRVTASDGLKDGMTLGWIARCSDSGSLIRCSPTGRPIEADKDESQRQAKAFAKWECETRSSLMNFEAAFRAGWAAAKGQS